METPAPVRVALVGYGKAGERLHAPLVAATQGMELAFLVTANAERRARAASWHPRTILLDSVDVLWTLGDAVDLVIIATPNTSHAALAIAALQHGFHVVIDKPMTVTVAEARLVCAEARRAGRVLSVFQNRRWDGDFLTIRSLLESGRLGTVGRVESRYERFRPAVAGQAWREEAQPGGGLLHDLGSHLIDQMLVLFGRPNSVYAEMIQRRPHALVDDDTFVALRYRQGLVAHLWMSLTTPVLGPRFRVWGRECAFEKSGMDVQEESLIAGVVPGSPGWGSEPEQRWGVLTTAGPAGVEHARIPTVPGSYQRYHQGVRDAILRGTPPPVTGEEGQAVIEVIEAALDSAKRRSVVHLGPRDAV